MIKKAALSHILFLVLGHTSTTIDFLKLLEAIHIFKSDLHLVRALLRGRIIEDPPRIIQHFSSFVWKYKLSLFTNGGFAGRNYLLKTSPHFSKLQPTWRFKIRRLEGHHNE